MANMHHYITPDGGLQPITQAEISGSSAREKVDPNEWLAQTLGFESVDKFRSAQRQAVNTLVESVDEDND